MPLSSLPLLDPQQSRFIPRSRQNGLLRNSRHTQRTHIAGVAAQGSPQFVAFWLSGWHFEGIKRMRRLKTDGTKTMENWKNKCCLVMGSWHTSTVRTCIPVHLYLYSLRLYEVVIVNRSGQDRVQFSQRNPCNLTEKWPHHVFNAVGQVPTRWSC